MSDQEQNSKVLMDTIKTYAKSTSDELRYEIDLSTPNEVPLCTVDARFEVTGTSRNAYKLQIRPTAGRFIELASDFHLHEFMDLDPSNGEDLLLFLNKWGLLHLPKDVVETVGLPHVRSAFHRWENSPFHKAPSATLIEIDEVRLAAGLLQAAIKTWVKFKDGDYLTEIWAEQGLEEPDGETQALRWILQIVNPGLVDAYPRIILVDQVTNAQPSGTEQPRGIGLGSLATVGLYEAICARIYNDMLMGLPYVHCRNENCGRRFMSKRSEKSRSKTRTTGVNYCSRNCQKSQQARQRRRRQKALKEAADET